MFKDNLKRLRLQSGLTQYELAKILDVSKSNICQFEKGTRIPSIEKIIQIADYFEESLDSLFDRNVVKRDYINIKDICNKIINNEKLSRNEISYVVSNFTNGIINDKEMSEFLLLVKEKSLSYEETFYLTEAMINSGTTLDLSSINKIVVDKHSTGGVGDKTTLIVGPIVASLGVGVAKMSGRSLGFTGGTIDKLESIPGYQLSVSNDDFINNVNKVGICLISQTGSLAPADKKIYALRDEIGAVESIPLIASSIMSKKIASGAKCIVIDLKVGVGAFMKNIKEAKTLAECMINIGKYFNRKVICVLSDMNYPLGSCIGNAIEVKEAENFFNGVREKRLEELVIILSSYMVSLGKEISFDEAKKLVIRNIYDGSAKMKFYEWLDNQGGDVSRIRIADNVFRLYSPKNGFINNIDPVKISKIVFELGAGRLKKENDINHSVGIRFNKFICDDVIKDELLLEVYYDKEVPDLEEKLLSSIEIDSIIKSKEDIIIDVII